MARDVEQFLDGKHVRRRNLMPVPHCFAIDTAHLRDTRRGPADVTHHAQDRIAPFIRPQLLSFHDRRSNYMCCLDSEQA
jgi:hypothetical protein